MILRININKIMRTIFDCRSRALIKCPVVDWIDRELAYTYQFSFNFTEKSDVLLEIRSLFSDQKTVSSLNKLIGSFYQLLPALESSHYLLGFRIRQWIAVNFLIRASDPLKRVDSVTYEILMTSKSVANYRKAYFEEVEYEVPLGDIRMEVIRKNLQDIA